MPLNTAAREARSAGPGGPAPTTPDPRRVRRLERPSWRDLRLVVGILLVVLSVAGGTRLITSLDRTTPVYAAADDLLPGQEVTEDDLGVVSVRMGDELARYVDGGQSLQPGTYLLRGVAAGELVPAGALGTARQALDKTVNVPLDPASLHGLSVGSVVDVWVSQRDDDAVGEAYVDPRLLLEGAVVDQVPAEGRGLGAATMTTSVSVVVPADRVGDLIGAVDQGARITLVQSPRTSGTADG